MTDKTAREIIAEQMERASMSYSLSDTASSNAELLIAALKAEGWTVAKLRCCSNSRDLWHIEKEA